MDNSTHDARIELAIAQLKQQDRPNVAATARAHVVAESTLRDRWRGKSMSKRAAASEYRQRLTFGQEEALIQQINQLTDRGIPPTPRIVRNMAEEMLEGPVGKNWTSDFVKRYEHRLTSVYLRNIDSRRTKSEYAPSYKQFYDLVTCFWFICAIITTKLLIFIQLIDGIKKYNITADNLYNWDEKGFIIGLANAVRRLMTKEALDSGRITNASQDGSREFISLLACICADETALPPALIYKGDSGSLQNTWIEDWQQDEEAFFASSANGWSSDAFGINWLQRIFQRYTAKKAGNRRRLLLVDGHSSHVNMRFIDLCDQLRILVLILPPHSTHRLQPLDVGLFSPLSRFYTDGLNKLMYDSLGMISMSKRSFWSVFLPAWKQAFTPKNIESAFRKTGIWPYDPSGVLGTITKPQAVETSGSPKTPMSSRAVRRAHRQYKIAPTTSKLSKILNANERLAATNSIRQHMIRGLQHTLRQEIKRRQRGKRLNLLGEEEGGLNSSVRGKCRRQGIGRP